MELKLKTVLVFMLFLVILNGYATSEEGNSENLETDSLVKKVGNVADDAEIKTRGLDDKAIGDRRRRIRSGRVSVSAVALFTLAMAGATGLGAVPFFFVELDPRWAGICNGMAAGVMLAASFDLIQEGQEHGSGNWVVLGILTGGIFIWLCKKILEQYGEVSMLDIKGADASKAILVVGIMTLHSFGEGSGVGVSFAGHQGLSQGLLVTLAIAVHNIPEGLAVSLVLAARGVSPRNAMLWSVITSLPQPLVAVPSFICADLFNKLLPFCTGFAAGCMIWMVIAEVLPDGFKEASPSHVASAATLSVAFMEALSVIFHNFSHDHNSEDVSAFIVSLLFGIGPLLGGITLIAFALAFHLHHALLTGVASGVAIILAFWRPLHLLATSTMGLFALLFLFALGSSFSHFSTASILSLTSRKRSSADTLSSVSGFYMSALTVQSIVSCIAVCIQALAEGLALGVATPKAYGLGGLYMVFPISLHGIPRGAAVASSIFGATHSWPGSLTAATVIGFVGPMSAIGAILGRIDNRGLDYLMVFACGGLIPAFSGIFTRAVKLDKRTSFFGLVMGAGFTIVCLTCSKLVCSHTSYCNSAPEAVR